MNLSQKTGWFDHESFCNEGLFSYSFTTGEKRSFPNWNDKDWQLMAVSPDGQRIVVRRDCVARGTNKHHLVVIDWVSGNILFESKDYFVFDVTFNCDGTKILFVSHGKNPICLDMDHGITPLAFSKELRLYTGFLDKTTDSIFVPFMERKKTFLVSFNFADSTFAKIDTGMKCTLWQLKASPDSAVIYASTSNNTVLAFDKNLNTLWLTDLNMFVGSDNTAALGLFLSEDGKLLCVSAGSTVTNSWGALYVLNTADGSIAHEIQGQKGRGRVECAFFDNKLLLYTGNLYDMTTGSIYQESIFARNSA